MIFRSGNVSSPAQQKTRVSLPISFSVLSEIPYPRNLTLSATISSSVDLIYSRSLSGVQVNDYQMNILSFGGASPSNVIWSSSNSSVATINQNGFMTHLSAGISTVFLFSNTTLIASKSLSFTETGGTQTARFVAYASGSVSRNCVESVDSRIFNKSPSASLRLFSSQNHTSASYIRNTASWCGNISDITCISPWNSVGINTRAGTLISPRHVIFAWHYQPSIGAIFRFVDLNNNVISRTMTNRMSLPNANLSNDITIGVLDSDVPTGSIGFAKVLPPDWMRYFPSLSWTATVPALCLDQEEKALVTDWWFGGGTGSAAFIIPNNINSASRQQYYEDKIGGDSGNPAFLIINNQLVLLTVWTYGGAGSGTFVTPRIDQINSVMSQLGGGYQLTTASLSGSFIRY